MASDRFKLFSPERLALIILALVLCVWAVIAILKRQPNNNAAPVPAYADSTVEMSIKTITPHPQESKKASKREPDSLSKQHKNHQHKGRKAKSKLPVRHRDHLNEPVKQL